MKGNYRRPAEQGTALVGKAVFPDVPGALAGERATAAPIAGA